METTCRTDPTHQLMSIVGDGALSCTMYRSFETITELREEWDRFAETLSADIFMTFDWCRVWWKHYGAGRSLLVYVFRHSGDIVGIVPMVAGPCGLPVVGARLARVLGGDSTIQLENPPVRGAFAPAVFRHVTESLLRELHCDAVYWGPLSAGRPFTQAIEDAVQNGIPEGRRTERRRLGVQTVYALPADLETYIGSMNKATRKHVRSSRHRLSRDFDLRFERAENEPGAFDAFVDMHTRQWQAFHKLGHFDDWPGGRAYQREQAETQGRQGRLRLYRLMLDGAPVVYRYGYLFAGRYHSFLPAREVNPQLDRYSLGQTSHVLTAERLLEEKACEIDSGPGHYPHKLQLGGEERDLVSVLVSADGRRCRLRVSALQLLSRLVHLLYYRIWFNRLAPRLPFPRKPLWKLWIRTRM